MKSSGFVLNLSNDSDKEEMNAGKMLKVFLQMTRLQESMKNVFQEHSKIVCFVVVPFAGSRGRYCGKS